jgi:hypothetical protein
MIRFSKLLKALVVALLKPAPRPSISASRRITPITRDMIHPRNKLLTRQDAADAYRRFYIDHFAPSCGAEVDDAYREVLNHISCCINGLEYERDELLTRLKQARYDLHEARREMENAAAGIGKEDCQAWVSAAEGTLARRQARLDAANARVESFKNDLRGFLVDFLNEKIKDHNRNIR